MTTRKIWKFLKLVIRGAEAQMSDKSNGRIEDTRRKQEERHECQIIRNTNLLRRNWTIPGMEKTS